MAMPESIYLWVRGRLFPGLCWMVKSASCSPGPCHCVTLSMTNWRQDACTSGLAGVGTLCRLQPMSERTEQEIVHATATGRGGRERGQEGIIDDAGWSAGGKRKPGTRPLTTPETQFYSCTLYTADSKPQTADPLQEPWALPMFPGTPHILNILRSNTQGTTRHER